MGKTFRVWSGSRHGGDKFKRSLRRERRQNLKQSIRNEDDNTIGDLISNNKAGWDLHRKSPATSFRAKAKSIERNEQKTLPKNCCARVYVANDNKNLVVSHIDQNLKGFNYQYNPLMSTIMV